MISSRDAESCRSILSVNIAISCILFLLLSGCAFQFHVVTEPPGADVYFDGRHLGKSPCRGIEGQNSPRHVYTILAKKDGYEDAKLSFPNTKPFTSIPNPVQIVLQKKRVNTSVKLETKKNLHATEELQINERLISTDRTAPSNIGARWIVVIGVSSYQDTRIPALRYASTDAQAVYKWAVSPKGGRYAPARAKLLIDQQATGASMKDALFNWLGQALEEDIVTIYFAGHGSPQSPDHPDNLFLLPHNCRYDNISTTGFPMWDIEMALERYIKAKKVVIIVDACHSGGVGQSFDIARRANRGLKVNPISTGIHNLSKVGHGICVISASDEQQFSQESKNWGGGHGVFTYFLLKGLKGDADYNRDTTVTLGELTLYLSQEVRRATKNAQSPTVAGRYDPALTIGK